jgi:hypothetical protein
MDSNDSGCIGRTWNRIWRLALVLAVAAVGSACSTLQGTPPRYAAAADVIDEIQLTPKELAELVESASKGERNSTQARAIAVIDQRFNQFVRDLAADRANAATAAAGTTLGASTAGAFVESVKAKTNYALFSAGIVGAFGIVDKNYFFEKAVPALVAAMGAARAKVLVRIRESQREEIASYDGTAALADLEDYYAAGTVLYAIAEITSRADQDRKLALAEVRELDVPTQDVIDARKQVTNAIFAIKTDEQVKKANLALKALQLPSATSAKEARDALRAARMPRTVLREKAVTEALAKAGLL